MRENEYPQLSANYLKVICQLHEWENQHLELTQTQVGRYLYLNIARQLQEKRGEPSALLKGIYHNKDISERALRYKIREFENKGWLEFEASNSDKRSKKMLPTDIFYKHMDAHIAEFGRILDHEFLLFPKK
jgi:DNA-binding MarR family transcriptional regulator